MAEKFQKLELTWIGKGEEPKLEPRILLENPDYSYGAANTNMLIHGDNLLALKALEQDYTGKIKCVYIDPPFNTGQAFEYYEDGIEHSLWLSLLKDRVKIIHKLLAKNGTLFVHIDDNELGYLIVLLDEIFGRSNRISIITFKQSSVSGPKTINPGLVTTNNFILYYAKDKSAWMPNRVFVPTSRDDRYSKYIQNIEEDHSKWKLVNLKEAFMANLKLASWDQVRQSLGEKIESKITEFVLSNPECVVRTARVAPKDINEQARFALQASINESNTVFCSPRDGKENYYFLNGEQLIFYKNKTKLIDGSLHTASALTNLWDDLLSNNLHNEGSVTFPNGKKPEQLLKRILQLATNPNDIVLDSFLGSGTTAAVAHKMGRRWIGIELGEHAVTHCVPRLKKVVDGTDQGGISKDVGWTGGGGFKFYTLAPSLLNRDKYGNWVISKEYNPTMLASAMAKQEGFRYLPDERIYWKQGKSSEKDYIYTTTQFITIEILDKIQSEMQPDESLLLACKAYHSSCEDRFPNITIKKIPHMLLGKCEFGKEDYSLNIVNSPTDENSDNDDLSHVETHGRASLQDDELPNKKSTTKPTKKTKKEDDDGNKLF